MLAPTFLALAFASYAAAQASPYGQCGGIGWAGPTTCTSGWVCTYSNDWYSQCLQATSTTTTTTTTATTTTKSSTTTTKSSTTTTTTPGSSTSTSTAPTSTATGGPSKLTGQLPALGWNSWNAYQGNINETKILSAAQQMVSLGLKDLGYEYVNIDDCWPLLARDATTGKIVPDPAKFPNGIDGLATQIHNLGLKIGIYGDAGTATCSGYPGSLGTEALDAATFAAWGIDYLKYDNCNVPANWSDTYPPPNNDYYNSNSALRYRQMSTALAAQSRPIQFSLCIWGAANVWEWGARVGHSWRMSGDSSATWSYFMNIITTNVQHLSAITFGAHNDMDMMEIGNGNLTTQEQRTHFAAWCFLKSPILLGTDLSLLTTDELTIIKNKELLAFHQDATVGGPAQPFNSSTTPPEYYAGASSKGIHVFIINTGSAAATKSFTLSTVPGLDTSGTYKFHDMWTSTDLSGTYGLNSTFSVSVAAHDTVAYLLTKV